MVDAGIGGRKRMPMSDENLGLWREPAEETLGLYPNLVVHDGRVTGSITIGRSRLPIWCIIGELVRGDGWDGVELGWSPEEHYGFTASDMSNFLYNLLEARGEFGRLLLVIADAERRESERDELWTELAVVEGDPAIEDLGDGMIMSRISLEEGDGGYVPPPPWWADKELAAPVIDQLKRCLKVLEHLDD